MSAAKKPRTPSRNPQARQIEFTPGQMIIAICTLIAFGLVCFMLGVLVNKLDTSFGPETPTVATTEQAPLETPVAASPPPQQQTSPMPPEALRERVASRNESEVGQPRTVPPPSATRRPDPPAQSVAPPPARPIEPEPVDEADVELADPVIEDPEPESPRTLIENEAPLTPETTRETTPEPQSPPSAAPAAAPGGTAYGVQIASLSTERQEQAQRALADAERAANQSGQLVRTEDGRFFRVIIGAFESRADATRLQERMRQQSQFEGCFVQTFTKPL